MYLFIGPIANQLKAMWLLRCSRVWSQSGVIILFFSDGAGLLEIHGRFLLRGSYFRDAEGRIREEVLHVHEPTTLPEVWRLRCDSSSGVGNTTRVGTGIEQIRPDGCVIVSSN